MLQLYKMKPPSMRLTTADLVVLAVLSYERPMHGYELVKLLEERDFTDWAPISRPQVYYSLRKLADVGFLIPVEDAEPARGPERVVYQPSEQAYSAMQTALAQKKWIEQRPPSPFTTWAALALLAEPKTVIKQIEDRAQFLRREIQREKATLDSFAGIEKQDVAVARILVSLAIQQFELELDTLDDLRAALTGS